MNVSQKKISCDEFDAYESRIDTEYFGIPSAKVLLKQACFTEQTQDALLSFMRGFEFVMIANKANDPTNTRWLGEKTKAFLVDMNIQLRKQVTPDASAAVLARNDRITSITDRQPKNDAVIHIAETYFTVSQFRNDPYLPKDEASRIYGDIVKNAFDQPGRYFVITKIADVVAGFLLFTMNVPDASATIQLIAVNQEFTRQGIGQSLIQSMEKYALDHGVRTIYVGTQVNNFGALKFYQSSGFDYFECTSIYHYWPMR